MTLLAKKNAVIDNRMMKTITLPMARWSEIPEDFMAANSYFSAKLPKTIKEVTKIVRGRTKGIRRGDTNHKNLRMIHISKSFPANSEI